MLDCLSVSQSTGLKLDVELVAKNHKIMQIIIFPCIIFFSNKEENNAA